MSLRTDETVCPFNAQEREYIRRELDLFFGTLPSVADGFQLRTWRSGPLAGQPKLPPALRTMVDSGLMEIRTDTPLPRAYFTERGLWNYPGFVESCGLGIRLAVGVSSCPPVA